MKALKALAAVVLLAALFGVGFGWKDIRQGRLPEITTVQRLLSPQEQLTPTELFQQHFDFIWNNYAGPVERDRLNYAAMSGLFQSLGDPHTQFLEPRATEDFNLETRGDFVGIGARLSPDPLGARVVNVFRQGPAMAAGLQAADLISSVDGKDVSGMDVADIVQLIRGQVDTIVTLQVIRADEPRPVELKIKRAKVTVPTAEAQRLPNDIGYIMVSQFAEVTPRQFSVALEELESEPLRGLVIDMRSNPGGLLDAAVDMLSLFVSDKTVVTMRFRGDREEIVRTYAGRTRDFPYPVVVLINEETASAGEIFAGVLRDYQRATLVGEHTYGKASVQHVFMLMDLSSAKVTIARYYLPGGQDISRRQDEEGVYLSGGISPDITASLELTPETMIGNPENDSQLAKAIEVIEGKLRR